MTPGMLPQAVIGNKNLLAKSRKPEDPYMIFTHADWEWRVLKAYKSRASETKDQYARWFLATKSPNTYGEFELGDGYVKDVVSTAECTFLSDAAAMAGYTLGRQKPSHCTSKPEVDRIDI